MSLETWIAFVAASTVVIVTPGPTIMAVVSYSVSHGRQSRLPLVAAVGLGDSTALLFSLFGLGALLAASALWFTILKTVGGLYLLWLGIKLLRGAGAGRTGTPPARLLPSSRLFLNTYAVTALNPKAIVFFVAFLPQFVSPTEATGGQLGLLALTFVALATLNAFLYATFAASARRALSSDRAQKRFNLASGSLLSGAGIWALFAKGAQ